MYKCFWLILTLISLLLTASESAALEADPVAATPAATDSGEAGEADANAQAEAEQIRAMVAGVTANPWKWTQFAGSDESVNIDDPASYVVTFNDDGTLEIQADCNKAFGTYRFDGANVSIEIGPATLAACPEDSRGEQFLQLLGDAARALPIGDKLYASLKTGDRTMILEAVLTTVVDLCGEQALAINTVEDTLDPGISAQLDQGLVSLLQDRPKPAAGVTMLIDDARGALPQVNRGFRRHYLRSIASRFFLPDRQQHENDDHGHPHAAPGGRRAFHLGFAQPVASGAGKPLAPWRQNHH